MNLNQNVQFEEKNMKKLHYLLYYAFLHPRILINLTNATNNAENKSIDVA